MADTTVAEHRPHADTDEERLLFPDTYAEQEPDRPAYIMASGEAVSYGEMVEASRAISGLLHGRGLRHGDTVAILMSNEAAYFKVAWGLQRAGLRYVAIATRLGAADVAYILGNCEADALIVGPSLLDLAREALALTDGVAERFTTGPDVDGFESLFEACAGSAPNPDEREGVDLLYSSGTTGRPKGIVATLPLAPLGTGPGFATLFHEKWGLEHDSIYLSPAPLYHAAPLRVCMTVHRYGGTVIVMDRFDAAAALELITPGVHGHLAEPGDERGFVHGAVQLAESPELRARMRLAARERVASLAWRAIVDSLVSLQRQVILSSPLTYRR